VPRLRSSQLLVLAILTLFIVVDRQPSVARAADGSGVAVGSSVSTEQPSRSSDPPIVVAPYFDVGLAPNVEFTRLADESGIRHIVLAFIVDGGGCAASWAGYGPLGSAMAEKIRSEVAALRAHGVEVVISFGGAINHELAITCADDAALDAQYQAVIDAYRPSGIDFDIEGSAQSDAAANDRRSRVLRALQERNPGLQISYTIPVALSGLTERGLAIVGNALSRGVRLSRLNLMTMYFGDEGRPRTMSENAIQAMSNATRQLSELQPSSAGISVPGGLGITPVIGANLLSGETFTVDDAHEVRAWANQQRLASLSFWSLNRDRPCAGVGADPTLTCSGVPQEPYAFVQAFAGLAPSGQGRPPTS
jgi:hypothetical protein